MGKLQLTLIAATLLSGCQTVEKALPAGSAPVSLSGPTASAIAVDMASRLADQIGPAGTTTIRMKNDSSEFATALEAALKGWGYTVIIDGKTAKDVQPVELAYAIDGIDGQVLARLTTSSIALGRAYTPTAAGATPSSPLSIMQRN
ncbi:conjugal transfer protein TrbH [Sinorhizobium americanum]|uniref:Conjugal transfer protein TrbH n=1 Tax=Sinorhizobium americanum TaxID=194963 RepID=A0A1L3LUE6_9HYPH|nr:conjugal transfer protein TrbH [Sinorhizobium americanum]APG87197.1 conjugal transfer protein TrbH [Sinorhizobium americanum CCGM7]APG93715.1 conjugal transfer protein TrbH [Sinorhizobium americanum]OAP48906.1 conjugal transfer protein TrbH [Sinorhizobium americanum]